MPQTIVFQQHLIRAWPPEVWRDVTVLVAVSGGPDSVALLCGLTAVRESGSGQLIAAHFNHGLRGEHALADEAFVVQLCQHLGMPCEVGWADRDADSGQEPDGRGTAPDSETVQDPQEVRQPASSTRGEATLRTARYRFLRDTAQRVGARYVATGHTADDQAETVLHRVLRGTGIAGLAGIRRYRELVPGVSLVRPLLEISRRQVQEYLDALGQAAREDRSNVDQRYTRNRIRHALLPHLAAHYNPNVVGAITRLATLAGDVQQVVAGLLEDLQVRCVKDDSPVQVTVDCGPLAHVPRYLVRELWMAIWRRQGWPLQAMGHERWEDLANLASTPPVGPWKRMFPGSIAAQRDGSRLQLRSCGSPELGTAR
jgi:tRNA(Ile)-lysidine synthase